MYLFCDEIAEKLALTLLLAAVLAVPAGARMVSHEQRMDVVRRAKLWQAVDVESMDLLNGPSGEGSYKLGEEIKCRYEERDPLRPLGGHTKKFPCHDAAGRRLKVKYDGKANTEVYGEVAASRLFWALGFHAERMYSIKIVCENCPKDPFLSDKPPRATRTFEPATVQVRLKGEEVSELEGEGWSFDDLARVEEKRGGSSRAEVDAFRLLAALVNHGDNTPNQQRLLCPDGDKACAQPLMYATDLGATFGGATFVPSFRNWSKKSIWKDPKACVADFHATWKTSRDPKISEAGRKFLADLLGRLSDKQVRDMFQGARFDVLGRYDFPMQGADGKSRRVTVDDWTRAFLKKRDDILKTRCPE